MNRTCALLVVSIAVVLIPGVQETRPADPAGAEEALVVAAFEKFLLAWETENLDEAVGAFTADAVVFDPVPPGKFAGADGVRTWTANSFEMLDEIDIEVSDTDIGSAGPAAWLTGRYVFKAQAQGEPVRDEGHLSMVWVRQAGGAYRATVFHASRLPEAEDDEGTGGSQ